MASQTLASDSQRDVGEQGGEIAATAAAPFRVDTRTYLTWRAEQVSDARGSTRRDSAAATARIDLSSATRPQAASILLEYRWNGARDDSAVLAGMLAYRGSAWTTSGALLLEAGRSSPAQWRYAIGASYRLSSRHRFGVEWLGPLHGSGAPKVMLGYTATIAPSLSVGVAVGSRIDAPSDLIARAAVHWRIGRAQTGAP